MGGPLRLLNLTLGVVAVLMATALAKTWVSPAASIPDRPGPKLSQEATPLAFVQTPRPPLAQFDVLLEKNPFKQPPPLPPQRGVPGRPAPPPPPLPALIGTILVDEERRAIVSDKGKQEIYAVNQEVAGGVITEIREDRIMYKRGDESVEIFLRTAIKTVSSPMLSPSGQAIVPAAPAFMPPPPIVNPDKLEQERSKLDKKLQREQQKLDRRQQELLRKQSKNR